VDTGRLLVVGDPFFLARHRPLTEALSKRLQRVREVPISEGRSVREALYLGGRLATGKIWPISRANLGVARQRFRKESSTFSRVSRLASETITKQRDGEFVLQIFSMFSPSPIDTAYPYAHYVDMTMAQVRRNWPAWAPFDRERDYQAWIALEGASYRGAARVFTFSKACRRSVIEDYGVDPRCVVAVGAAGNYREASDSDRGYGNYTLVFNGSDFDRKGGDRVLAAFRIVRDRFPDAHLSIVGYSGKIVESGVSNDGHLPTNELFEIFDRTDVVLAPTKHDAFPGFVLEAMSRGVVAVLSDAEAMDEIVTDGKDGYVVSPPTPENLAARVIQLFENPNKLRQLGAAGRERIVREFNWDAVAARMIESLQADGLI
jgi:glycosyltransferase involved in cell wall biosynthesis